MMCYFHLQCSYHSVSQLNPYRAYFMLCDAALNFMKTMTSILFSFYRLVEEVGEISETVESLQAKLRMAENSLQELLRTKASLEQDLSIKNNSLFIDREKCLGMRKTFPMSPRVVSV